MSVDMKVIPVPADGDCFYHAFIKGLRLAGLTPHILRDIVAQKILSDSDLYDDLVKEWIDFDVIQNANSITPEIAANHIRDTKEWSTSTIIHILATAFNVRIVVFQNINGRYFSEIFPSEWKDSPQTRPYKDIYILRRGCHYELLVPVKEIVSNSRKIPASRRESPRSTRRLQRGGGLMEKHDTSQDNHLWLTRVLGLAGFILLLFTV